MKTRLEIKDSFGSWKELYPRPITSFLCPTYEATFSNLLRFILYCPLSYPCRNTSRKYPRPTFVFHLFRADIPCHPYSLIFLLFTRLRVKPPSAVPKTEPRLTYTTETSGHESAIKFLLRETFTQSEIPYSNKLTTYKINIRPIWTYELELLGLAKPSYTYRIQLLQSIILEITYVRNYVIHNQVPFVNDLASIRYKSFHLKLITHTDPLVRDLSSPNIPGIPSQNFKGNGLEIPL